jgi:hypothetical protein
MDEIQVSATLDVDRLQTRQDFSSQRQMRLIDHPPIEAQGA